MKKFYLLVVILFLSVSAAHAYITSESMTTEQFLKDEGYSAETCRIMRTKIEPQEVAKEKEEKKNKTNKFVYYLKKCYVYLDPYTDNENFGSNDIKFKHTWDENN